MQWLYNGDSKSSPDARRRREQRLAESAFLSDDGAKMSKDGTRYRLGLRVGGTVRNGGSMGIGAGVSTPVKLNDLPNDVVFEPELCK